MRTWRTTLPHSVSGLLSCKWLLRSAAVFQMVVIDPIWTASPPESVRAFFLGTPFAQALARFHLNPLLLVGEICLLGALILYWNVPSLRKWILLVVGIQVIVIAGTVFMSTR